DVRLLLKHLLGRYAREMGREVTGFAPEADDCLTRYPWPGNVREMQNVVRQALLLSTGPGILADCLPRAVRDPGAGPSAPPAAGRGPVPGADEWETFVTDGLNLQRPELYARALERMERGLLGSVLRYTAGHQTKAAQLLGITRGSLRHKLRALGMDA